MDGLQEVGLQRMAGFHYRKSKDRAELWANQSTTGLSVRLIEVDGELEIGREIPTLLNRSTFVSLVLLPIYFQYANSMILYLTSASSFALQKAGGRSHLNEEV